MAELLTEKTGQNLANGIDNLIKSLNNLSGGFVGNMGGNTSLSKNNDNDFEQARLEILNKRLENEQKYIILKKEEDKINAALLKNGSEDLTLEQQKEKIIKNISLLEELRNANISNMNASEIKNHEKLIKLAEKDLKSSEKNYTLIDKKNKLEKKESLFRKKYNEENLDAIKKETELKIKEEKKAKDKENFNESRHDKLIDKRNNIINNASSSILSFVEKTLMSLFQQDSVMSKLSANYTLAREESKLLKENILKASISTAFIGVKTEDLVKMQSTYTDELGRSVMLNEDGMIALSEMAIATGLGVESTAQMAAQMERFGYNAVSSSKAVENLMNLSKKSGVSASVATKSLLENIKVAQSYTFKNGIAGVSKMTVFSEKLKINMSSIAQLSEKISSPEGAIQTAASLQVLGGAFAQMSDPMTLLNQGITDMEGLTKTYSKMLDGVADLNKETGEVIINGYERLRIKAAAEAMGVSFDEMMETARVKAKRKAIDSKINFIPVIKNESEETKDLIASLSQFDKKDKEFKISIGGQQKLITKLTSEDIKKLQPLESKDNLRTIALNTQGLTDIISNGFNAITQTLMPKLISLVSDFTNWLIPRIDKIISFFSSEPGNSIGVGGFAGAGIGGLIGGALGTMFIPVPGVGTAIGTLGGAAIGGLIGGGIGGVSANDVIIPSEKGSKPIFLNKKDDVYALKPNGAISQSLNSGSNTSNIISNFRNSTNISSPNYKNNSNIISSSNNISKMYQDVYPSRSGILNQNTNTSSIGNNKLNTGAVNGKIELNISGTINLSSSGNATKISASELVKDRNFVRELTRIIGNQLNRDTNGGKYSGGLNNNSF